MANNTSQHILNTAANLLGFCLFVITSLHMSAKSEHVLDELTCVVAILLTFSCGFSFTSLRAENPKKERTLERIAEYLFFLSLVGILIVIILIAHNVM